MFELFDPDGGVRRVPTHRVLEVYRDGRYIWKLPDSHHRIMRFSH